MRLTGHDFIKWVDHDLVIQKANHTVSITAEQSLDSSEAHAARQHPVKVGRGAASLEVSQDGDLNVKIRGALSHHFRQLVRAADLRSLRHYNKARLR